MIHALVVDDDASVRHWLHRGLTQRQCQVQLAEDPREGWGHLQSPGITHVITDWHMPNGGGEWLIDRIVEQDLPIPVVIISGALPPQPIKPAWRGKPITHLPKPFTIAKLIQTLT